jgi:hypothetical protein
MGDDTYKVGLVHKKKEKLAALRTIINSHKDSLDYLYMTNKFHPERIKLSKLKVLTSEWLDGIREYQELHKEIEELE